MSLDLTAALAAPAPPAPVKRTGPAAPKAGDPGTWEWDGTAGVINTPTLSKRPTTWDDFIRDAGLNPADVEVVEPVTVKGWDALGKAGSDGVNPKRRLRYYSLRVRARRGGPSIDELVKIVNRRRPATGAPKRTGEIDGVFSIDAGDLQLGKIDGDGVEGTVTRICDGLDRAAVQLKRLRRAGLNLPDAKLAWLGDCGEGFVSQGGTNAWRTTLTQTEQNRLLRRIMLYGVDVFSPLVDELYVLAIPGNHDQAVRVGGKGITRYDDSFDVDALAAVSEALKLNESAYGHVTCHTPAVDELTVTLDLHGTIAAHAHGHMWRPGKALEWWQRQAFGDQLAGQADVLFSGHLHHLRVEQSGRRTHVQVPALESESTWWRHSTGTIGAPGVLTSVLADRTIGHLHVV